MLPSFAPHVGMKFRNPEEAWKFWLAYGGQTGFEVRKRYSNKSKTDGKVTYVGLFVPTKVIEGRIKEMSKQNVQELKQEQIVKCACVL